VSLPIRVRMTAWYIAVLTAIVAVLGPFVVLQFRADLRAGIDRDARRTWRPLARQYAAGGLQDFASYSDTVLPRDGADQVFDSGGRLLASWGDAAQSSVIATPAVRADALAGRTRVVTVQLGGEREAYRAFVGPIDRLGQRQVLAVAEPFQPVEDSVQRVLTLLLFTVPAALAAAAAGGWWLARKALRPVERMTSKAEQIGIDRLGDRIAVPRGSDELSHLAVTLNAMLDRLQAGVAEKQRLVADASHDLRSPLAVMRAELDVNLRGDLTPASRAVLESVREEVDRMSRTVDNLLTLAQADEGQLQLLTAPLVLRDRVQATLRSLAPAAAAKGIVLEEADALPAGEPGLIDADAHRVDQMLANLVENAIKYTPAGGEVTVSTWRRGDEVGVTVADTGPGIPPEALDHVFDRFFRVDGARRRTSGGSGLGLAICREIVEAHGGRVWVESEPGHGSAFSLALPAAVRMPPEREPHGVTLENRS
jgi:two-component system, OmpR family, sensor kinase